MSCSYATWDGAYVLGALSPEDRRSYEEHLATCSSCAGAVRDMAGLPGLLSRLPADEVLTPPARRPPDTLLPRLIAAAAARRRLARIRLTAVLAAAAVAVGLALLGLGVISFGSAGSPAGRTLQAVGDAPLRATVRLTDRAWGTQVDMRCSYPPYDRYQNPATATWYRLVAVQRSGRVAEVASWRSTPGRVVHVTASTSLRRSALASLQVRTPEGRTVLQLANP